MWELSLTCSVYRREDWLHGLPDGSRPTKENEFVADLDDAQDPAQLAQTIKQCVHECECWLNRQSVSLVSHVVLTLYSLEYNRA